MKINLEFYSKETEFLEKEFDIEVPQKMVFEAAETTDLDDIRTLVHDVTPDFADYVCLKYPDISQYFEIYDAQFTGSYDEEF